MVDSLTTDHEALLAAVRENLQDDAPRLILADYLDERDNNCAYAEFIRVQCELAEIRSTNADGVTYEKIQSLRRRERELWLGITDSPNVVAPNWQTWFGKEHDLLFKGQAGQFGIGEFKNANGGWKFSRGFVSHITCRMEDWVGGVCQRCNGYGHHHRDDSLPVHAVAVHRPSLICADCKGTGRIPGHGSAIVRAECAAVERVTFSDKRPFGPEFTGALHHGWQRGSLTKQVWSEYRKRWQYGIDDEIFELLEGNYSKNGDYYWYDSEADAIAALSEAAIEWAWKQSA